MKKKIVVHQVLHHLAVQVEVVQALAVVALASLVQALAVVVIAVVVHQVDHLAVLQVHLV